MPKLDPLHFGLTAIMTSPHFTMLNFTFQLGPLKPHNRINLTSQESAGLMLPRFINSGASCRRPVEQHARRLCGTSTLPQCHSQNPPLFHMGTFLTHRVLLVEPSTPVFHILVHMSDAMCGKTVGLLKYNVGLDQLMCFTSYGDIWI